MRGADNRNENLAFYDRQMRISGWNQDKISSTAVLVVGLGGIGTNVASACCRLGVKEVIAVDHDKVEPSNLNRQALYRKADIGRSKADAARKTLSNLHDLTSTLDIRDMNIFQQWREFLELVKKSDVVMNGLDFPDVKKLIVASACLRYSKPMITSGTDPISGCAGMVSLQMPNGKPCFECIHSVANTIKKPYSEIEALLPENIERRETITIADYVGERQAKNPPAATNICTASIASHLAVNTISTLINGWPTHDILVFDIRNLELQKWTTAKPSSSCILCGDKSRRGV